jgi:hypothetical protein
MLGLRTNQDENIESCAVTKLRLFESLHVCEFVCLYLCGVISLSNVSFVQGAHGHLLLKCKSTWGSVWSSAEVCARARASKGRGLWEREMWQSREGRGRIKCNKEGKVCWLEQFTRTARRNARNNRTSAHGAQRVVRLPPAEALLFRHVGRGGGG